MKNVLEAPFLTQMTETTSNMYRLGWDERNGGNISFLIDEKEAGEYIDPARVIRSFPIGFDASALGGRIMLVTGTGKYFKNVAQAPQTHLGILRISPNGESAELLWGFADGGSPTSELPTHILSHIARLSVDNGHRVVLHCHPANAIAMSVVHTLDESSFTRSLWQMSSECIIVFPEGVGVLPWMVCGTNDIGTATANKMKQFRIVVWAVHGIYGVGRTLDEAFGLVETVEKAAQIYMLTSAGKRLNVISDDGLRRLAEAYGVDYRHDFLNNDNNCR